MRSMDRKPYPTDFTDEQWKLIENLLPPAKPDGRPLKTHFREVLNALCYLGRARRLSKDNEKLIKTSDAKVMISAIYMMVERLQPSNNQFAFAYRPAQRRAA